MGGAWLRVASVPASHVYVRHLSAVDGDDNLLRLADPIPADGRTVPGGWWPPVMLDPMWITSHRHEFDIFHIHFGFDTIDPEELAGICSVLRSYEKPLVYTVHDLRNPHQRDPARHRSQLDVLILAADELITLTPGAARAIETTWGRSATVLSHPHVLDRRWFDTPRRRGGPFVVGVHVKSLRPNMDPFPVLDTLLHTVSALPGAVLRIDVHDEIFDPENYWYAPEMGAQLLRYDRYSAVEVRVHPYFSDDELWDYLSSLSVSVLPYRFGTHSGWLEACHDLGTAVVVPSCGFYRQQRRCEVFTFDESRFDPDSLDSSVRRLYGTTAHRATWPDRADERVMLACEHRSIYDRALE